ncbi:MAG: S-methyl-5'-thioadenosine phosphorylase [Firmicutes bacterium]|nr:S-methyl-5'-thioadenosine phosphorylase [Bacillota bacterium]
MRLGIIGGTGVYDPDILDDAREVTVSTPYGEVRLLAGRYRGEEVAFMNRHGAGHSLPPHRVNYRANIWALKELGVERVIATAAVGALRREHAPGSLILCDQFLDFTKSRPATFYEGGEAGVVHVDVTEPYCPELRALMEESGRAAGLPVKNGGVYVCTEGPRFETAAEIRVFAQLGGDVVGMTGVPEVVLARELGLCYSTVAMVANLAAGLSPTPLTHSEVVAVMNQNVAHLRRLIMDTLPKIPAARERCGCAVRPEVHGRAAAGEERP